VFGRGRIWTSQPLEGKDVKREEESEDIGGEEEDDKEKEGQGRGGKRTHGFMGAQFLNHESAT
jgi:hypothetical protein